MSKAEPSKVISMSCHDLLALLNHHYQRTGSLDISSDHSTFSVLLDCLAAMNAESLLKERWDGMMDRLAAFRAEHGHCNTHSPTNTTSNTTAPTFNDSDNEDGSDLDGWVRQQRRYYQQYEKRQLTPLTSERYRRLQAVGLTSAPDKWELKYRQLKQYKHDHGHADAPIDHKQLGIWCLNQRLNLPNMPRERIEKLDALSFTWNYNTRSSNEEAWDAKYRSLLAYVDEHGHANVPKSNEPLSCWVRKQRYEYGKFVKRQKSQITRERIRKLQEVGFAFRPRADAVPWERHFDDLVRYRREHGHCRVPRNHPTLGSWVTYQKSQFKYFLEGRPSTMDRTKADKLVLIGFIEIEGGSNDDSFTSVIPVLPPMAVGAHAAGLEQLGK